MAVNGILTEAEIALFIAACQDELGSRDLMDASDVIDARGTLVEWIERYGNPDTQTNDLTGLTLHQWRRVQSAKGQPRKDVVLVEFSGARVAVELS